MEKVVLRVTIVVDKFNMPQYTYHYCPYLKQWWWFNDVGWLNNYLKNHLHHSTTVNIVTSIQNSNWLVFYGQECVIDLRNGQNWSMNLTLKSVILSKHWSVFLLKFSKQNVAFSTTATVHLIVGASFHSFGQLYLTLCSCNKDGRVEIHWSSSFQVDYFQI